MVDEHGGIDRAMEDRRAQAGEQRAAVEEDQIELAAEPGQGARPGRSGQEFAGPGHGAAHRQDREVILGSIDQGIGEGSAALDHVIQAHLGAQAHEAREHRPGEVGVDRALCGTR